MAISLGGSSGGGRKRHRSMSEINVTPMVDVMLVLLVIFMITAPTLKEGFAVDIPRADATQSLNIEDAHIITVTEQGLVLKDKATSSDDRYDRLGDLVKDLRTYQDDCAKNKKTPTVVIVGDKNARYESIVRVWNAVIASGVGQVSFQVEPGAPDELKKP